MAPLSFRHWFSLRRLHTALQGIVWSSVLIGVATPLVLAGGYNWFRNNDARGQEIAAEIVTVARRDITLAIKALGTVTLANEQQLRFNVQGKVQNVLVRTGDTVQRDDLIAELDKTDPNADIRQAQLAVNDAYLRLQELEASRNQTILSAHNNVRDLERQLENAYGDLPTQHMQVENQITQAGKTVLEKEAAYQKAQRNMAMSIEDAIVSADSLLDSILEILSGESIIRGASRHNVFVVDFLYNDQGLKNATEMAYYDATNAYAHLRAQHGSLVNVEDTRTLQSALQDAIAMAQNIVDLASVAYEFLKTAVPLDGKYTDAELNTLKAAMNTKRSTAITLLNTMRDQQALLIFPGKSAAYQELELARESLALLESQKQHSTTAADGAERTVSNLNDRLRAARESLEQTQVSTDVGMSQQRNALAQKQFALEKARRALENYELRAPFDGIVRRVDFQVGDNLLADAGETKYVILENPAYFVVTVQLDQVDVVHVKERQQAIIAFDAIPGTVFRGAIDLIDTTPVQTSGVVSYEVKIILEPSAEYTILSGMTATVEIQIASAANAIAVPNLALSTVGNRTFVVREDGSRAPIETGMTDGTYTEVLSGLEVGERIQSINVALNTAQSTVPQVRTGQRGVMMFPGGGPLR